MKNLFLAIVTLLIFSIGFSSCKKDDITKNRRKSLTSSQISILGSNNIDAVSILTIDSSYYKDPDTLIFKNYQNDPQTQGQTVKFTSDSIVWKNSSNIITKESSYSILNDSILILDNTLPGLILGFDNNNKTILLKEYIGSGVKTTFYNK